MKRRTAEWYDGAREVRGGRAQPSNTVDQNDDFACDKSLRLRLLSDADIDPEGKIAHAEDANAVSLSAYGQHVLDLVRGLRAGRPGNGAAT